jgi:CheY-like chemotaxis protein
MRLARIKRSGTRGNNSARSGARGGVRGRKLVCELPTGRGYRVLETVRGKEAIRIAAEHHRRIRLLLADVVLPEIGRPQALERIRALYPHLKVPFMSGYMDAAVAHHGILYPGAQGAREVLAASEPSPLLRSAMLVMFEY